MSKILVTGGAGFIGSHLVDCLLKDGHEVTVVDNLATGQMRNINWDASFINCDISKAKKFDKVVGSKKYDVVYHLAAQINLRESLKNPAFDAKTNVLGSLNVLSLAQEQCAKFVFASTGGAIYSPDSELPWTEQSLTEPESPYGLAKLTVEKYLKISNVSYCVLRLANVYGPRQNAKGEAGVISIFIDKIKNQEDLIIFGDGKQTRDFVYVSDVVDAFILAQNLEGTFNVSSNTQTSVLEVADLVRDRMWHNANVTHGVAFQGELRHSCLDSSLLQSKGWLPKIELSEGVARTVNYFVE